MAPSSLFATVIVRTDLASLSLSAHVAARWTAGQSSSIYEHRLSFRGPPSPPWTSYALPSAVQSLAIAAPSPTENANLESVASLWTPSS